MNVISYVASLILGWIAGSFFIVALTTMRVGLPMCNQFLIEKKEIVAICDLRKRYFISLIVLLPLIVGITILCYMLLRNGFYCFIAAFVIMTLLGIGSTGKNENNLREFYHSLDSTIARNNNA